MRVVSYNTRACLGMDNVRSTRRVGAVVRSLTPDIVAFQEIDQRLSRSGWEDQPLALAAGLNRVFTFHRLLRFGRGGYGIGMAVRGTIVERQFHLLPGGKEQRGALALRLRDVDGLNLTAICTHWGLDPEERLLQARALADIVNAVRQPVVVCGDFNEDASGAGVQLLLQETQLKDADGERQRPTFIAGNPTARIDFVFYSGDLRATRAEVIESLASDHLPLVVDFSAQR